MPFIFICKDRYKIIISYLRGFLISRPNNAFSRRTFSISWNRVFVFHSLKKKNKMLSWALSHLSFLFQPFLAPFISSDLPPCLSASLPLVSPLLLSWPLPARPAPLIFRVVLQSLCSLTSEFHQPLSLLWAQVPPASEIGLDEQTQSQKETFFGFLSWKLVSREFTVLFSRHLFEVFDWKEEGWKWMGASGGHKDSRSK